MFPRPAAPAPAEERLLFPDMDPKLRELADFLLASQQNRYPPQYTNWFEAGEAFAKVRAEARLLFDTIPVEKQRDWKAFLEKAQKVIAVNYYTVLQQKMVAALNQGPLEDQLPSLSEFVDSGLEWLKKVELLPHEQRGLETEYQGMRRDVNAWQEFYDVVDRAITTLHWIGGEITEGRAAPLWPKFEALGREIKSWQDRGFSPDDPKWRQLQALFNQVYQMFQQAAAAPVVPEPVPVPPPAPPVGPLPPFEATEPPPFPGPPPAQPRGSPPRQPLPREEIREVEMAEAEPVAEPVSEPVAEPVAVELSLQEQIDQLDAAIGDLYDRVVAAWEEETLEEWQQQAEQELNTLGQGFDQLRLQMPDAQQIALYNLLRRIQTKLAQPKPALKEFRKPPKPPVAKEVEPPPFARVTLEQLQNKTPRQVIDQLEKLIDWIRTESARAPLPDALIISLSTTQYNAYTDYVKEKVKAKTLRAAERDRLYGLLAHMTELIGQLTEPDPLKAMEELDELRQRIDAITEEDPALWPNRDLRDRDVFEKMVWSNFQRIGLEPVPPKEYAEGEPVENRCLAEKRLDLHQKLLAAWVYCPSSTGALAFWSTGSGKTAGAWATLSMFRNQVHSKERPQGKRLFWITKQSLIDDFWKDKWAFSDQTKEEIKEDVNVINYTMFTNLLKCTLDPAGYGCKQKWPEFARKKYGIQQIGDTTALMRNMVLIIDEAHFLFEKPTGVADRPDGAAIQRALFKAYGDLVDEPEAMPKLVLLSATPFQSDLTTLFRLYNLLIPNMNKEARLPVTMDEYYAQFCDDKGELTTEGRKRFKDLTVGLVCCYDGRLDRTAYAKVEIMPMVAARGTAQQLARLKEVCKDKEGLLRAECDLMISDWSGPSAPRRRLSLASNINITKKADYNPAAAKKAYFEPQPEPALNIKAKRFRLEDYV